MSEKTPGIDREQLVVKLQDTTEDPKKIDDIPTQNILRLFEEPDEVLEEREMIHQALKICFRAHDLLERFLEESKKPGGRPSWPVQSVKVLGPDVSRIYQSLVTAIEEKRREYEKLLEETEDNKRVPGGKEREEPVQQKAY